MTPMAMALPVHCPTNRPVQTYIADYSPTACDNDRSRVRVFR